MTKKINTNLTHEFRNLERGESYSRQHEGCKVYATKCTLYQSMTNIAVRVFGRGQFYIYHHSHQVEVEFLMKGQANTKRDTKTRR